MATDTAQKTEADQEPEHRTATIQEVMEAGAEIAQQSAEALRRLADS